MSKLDENMMLVLPELSEREINILLFTENNTVYVTTSVAIANIGSFAFPKPIDIKQLMVMKRKDAITRILGAFGGLIPERDALAKKIEHLP